MRAKVASYEADPSTPKTSDTKKNPAEAYFRFISLPLDAYLDEVLSARKEGGFERAERISRALYLKFGWEVSDTLANLILLRNANLPGTPLNATLNEWAYIESNEAQTPRLGDSQLQQYRRLKRRA